MDPKVAMIVYSQMIIVLINQISQGLKNYLGVVMLSKTNSAKIRKKNFFHRSTSHNNFISQSLKIPHKTKT